MCTVGIINAGVERVFVAEPDPPAGTLLNLDRLPPIWGEFAKLRDLNVTAVDGDDVPHDLVCLLNRLFLDGKDALDHRLNSWPALPVRELAAFAQQWRDLASSNS
jgi:hypothetical protein